MRKKQFYVMLSVLSVVSILLFLKIESPGHEEILIFSFVIIASFILLYFAALNYRIFQWISIIGYSLLALSALLAGFENEDYSFGLITIGYTYLASIFVRAVLLKRPDFIRQSEETQLPPHTFQIKEQQFEYPLLLRRCQALFIDGMLLLVAMIIVMVTTEKLSNAVSIRIIVSMILSLSYEPLLTSYSATLGQRLMGIRVRDVHDPSKRINAWKSYLRVITKSLLGWLSFITIHFNREHRAIHDFVGSSVMIKVKQGQHLK